MTLNRNSLFTLTREVHLIEKKSIFFLFSVCYENLSFIFFLTVTTTARNRYLFILRENFHLSFLHSLMKIFYIDVHNCKQSYMHEDKLNLK